MSETKIKKIPHYTYETTDEREFEDLSEAEEWQSTLDTIGEIVMFDDHFIPVVGLEDAMYVKITTEKQLDAYERMRSYIGLCARIPHIGIFKYDERTDKFIDLEDMFNSLREDLETIKSFGN